MGIISDKVKNHTDGVKTQAEKWKEYAGKAVSDYKKMSAERKIKKLEEQLRRDIEEQNRVEAEKQEIEDERARLVRMNEKELMVEAILAIRGLYHEFVALREKQSDLTKEIASLEADLSTVRQTAGSKIPQEKPVPPEKPAPDGI